MKLTLLQICTKYKNMGYDRIIVNYSGSGDDGGVNSITISGIKGDIDLPATSPETSEEEDILAEFVYNKTGADFNNEGSQGTFTFNIANLTYEFHHEDNIVRTEDTDDGGEIVPQVPEEDE